MSKDNAGHRILSPRRTTQGAADSLHNTYGDTLLDGCQCFVLTEEANYRFLKSSVLHADGKFVVQPISGPGRWVREGGTLGLALLDNGTVEPGEGERNVSYVQRFADQTLVQFAAQRDGVVVYTGAVTRMALLFGTVALESQYDPSDLGHAVRGRTLSFRHGDRAVGSTPVDHLGYSSVSAIVSLKPGDTLRLAMVHTAEKCVGQGLLRIVLA